MIGNNRRNGKHEGYSTNPPIASFAQGLYHSVLFDGLLGQVIWLKYLRPPVPARPPERVK